MVINMKQNAVMKRVALAKARYKSDPTNRPESLTLWTRLSARDGVVRVNEFRVTWTNYSANRVIYSMRAVTRRVDSCGAERLYYDRARNSQHCDTGCSVQNTRHEFTAVVRFTSHLAATGTRPYRFSCIFRRYQSSLTLSPSGKVHIGYSMQEAMQGGIR
jgi:hypothetical protein